MSYTTNKEYRQALRDFFKMKCPDSSQFAADIDEETLDELMYDAEAVEHHLNQIYAKTKDSPVFREIYEIAAGLMFSLDRETGLAVLLSYDYFPLFVPLYQQFDEGATAAQITASPEYGELMSRISRR